MTRAKYETSICARVDQAVHVPYRSVSLGAWSPKVADCHQNVDTWVRANPGSEAVRGWVTYASFGGNSVGLTAHSIVRDQNGMLFDITPLGNEDMRAGMRFIEHEGEPAAFFETKALGINIHCLEFDATELTAEQFDTECYEIGEDE